MSHQFYVSEDEEDEQNGDSWKLNPKKNFFDECYENDNTFKTKIDEITRLQNSVLSGTKFCNQSVNDSEKIGSLTSEELSQQREQLKRIEGNIDNLDSNLNVAQRQINSLKTFFGSVSNYFSSSKKGIPLDATTRKPSIQASNSINSNSTNKNQFLQALNAPSAHNSDSSRDILTKPLGKKQFDAIFDQEIDVMSHGVNRLKDMALNMGTEIDSQNSMIDNYIYKIDNTNNRITEQNKQMKKILGGK